MKSRWALALAAISLSFCVVGRSRAEPAPQSQALAPGVWLIPGGIAPNRQPDGNTVMFDAPQGLIVVDTGRHLWQRRAILDFAKAKGRPIVAIVNSHWHLDHVSGDPDLKRAYPGARIWASGAIDQALVAFLPKSAAEDRKLLAEGGLPPETADDIRGDIATIEDGRALRPDVVISRSSVRRIGGLRLDVNLAPHAATDADVWLYDPKTGVAAVADLVTLPAPFLDTACAGGWRAALDEISAVRFKVAVPGHGAPMSRAQFDTWRNAFATLIDCAASSRDKHVCAADWTRATAELRGPDPASARQAQGMTEYYVSDVLRAHGGNSAYCTAAA